MKKLLLSFMLLFAATIVFSQNIEKKKDSRTVCGHEATYEAAAAKIRDQICAEGETKQPSLPMAVNEGGNHWTYDWCVTFTCNLNKEEEKKPEPTKLK